MAARLEQESGRSVDEWVQLTEESGHQRFSAVLSWLKDEHGLGHFQARLIAEVRRDGHL